jgi:hypothetical protein
MNYFTKNIEPSPLSPSLKTKGGGANSLYMKEITPSLIV